MQAALALTLTYRILDLLGIAHNRSCYRCLQAEELKEHPSESSSAPHCCRNNTETAQDPCQTFFEIFCPRVDLRKIRVERTIRITSSIIHSPSLTPKPTTPDTLHFKVLQPLVDKQIATRFAKKRPHVLCLSTLKATRPALRPLLSWVP